MRTGDLDRRITIDKPVNSLNEYGESESIWTPVATVWAQVKNLSGRELFAAQQITPEVQFEIVIRWRSDLDETMRITHDSKVYGISHIAEIGRREGLKILVKTP